MDIKCMLLPLRSLSENTTYVGLQLYDILVKATLQRSQFNMDMEEGGAVNR